MYSTFLFLYFLSSSLTFFPSFRIHTASNVIFSLSASLSFIALTNSFLSSPAVGPPHVCFRPLVSFSSSHFLCQIPGPFVLPCPFFRAPLSFFVLLCPFFCPPLSFLRPPLSFFSSSLVRFSSSLFFAIPVIFHPPLSFFVLSCPFSSFPVPFPHPLFLIFLPYLVPVSPVLFRPSLSLFFWLVLFVLPRPFYFSPVLYRPPCPPPVLNPLHFPS